MTRAIIVLIFWLASGFSAYAQSPVSVTGPVTPGNLPVFNSTTIIKDSGIPAGGFLPQHPISAAYQLTSADCGSLIVATGGTFYAVSQSGSYPVNCVVRILNNDPMPTGANSTGAKFVNFVNCVPSQSGTYLWPQQTMEVTLVSGAWVPTRCPGLWEAPSSTFTINIDPINGSNAWGAADGLAASTRAFASVNDAMDLATEVMQANFISDTSFNFKLCASCTDSSLIHFPPHGSPLNSQGRAGLIINCNGGTLSGGVSIFFPGGILELTNCTLTATVGVTEGAELILDAGNSVTPVSGQPNFSCSTQSKIFTNGQTLTVNAGSGSNFANVSSCSGGFPPVNLVGNVTYSDATLRVQASGYFSFGAWTLNGNTVTGTKYILIECGIVEGAANIPGSVSGSASCTQAN